MYGSATYVSGQPPLTEAQADAFRPVSTPLDSEFPNSGELRCRPPDFWYLGVPASNIPPIWGLRFLAWGRGRRSDTVTTGNPAVDLPDVDSVNPEYMVIMPFTVGTTWLYKWSVAAAASADSVRLRQLLMADYLRGNDDASNAVDTGRP